MAGLGGLRSTSSLSTPAGCVSSSTTCVSGEDDTSDLGDLRHDHVTSFWHRAFSDSADDNGLDKQVYMGIVWQSGKLGVSYYDVDTTQIYMMPDTEETEEFTLMHRVLQQIQPSCVVVSSKQDDRLLKSLKTAVSDILMEREDRGSSSILQVLPSIDFLLDICKRRILSLNLPMIPKHFLDSERTLFLSSLVPFENVCLVRAMGGLLKYLEKARVGVELEDQDVKVPVLGLNVFSLAGQLIVDYTTLSALQVFQKECHPSVYKSGQGSGAKEGLSLFGILNRCRSQIGSKMLRLWFLRPLKDVSKLKERQDAISFFVNPRNIEVTNTLHSCLKNIKAVPRILTRMIQAQASTTDWQALYKTTYNAMYIGDVCKAQSKSIKIFAQIAQSFSEDIHRIATLISKIVDFDESVVQNRFVVRPGIDPELDEKKRTYNGLPDFMTKVARQELTRLSADITECNVRYLPQLGYLLAIPRTDKMQSDEDFAIPGLDFVREVIHNLLNLMKRKMPKELDAMLGDTQCEITDHETSIMHRLQNTILEHSKVLMDVMLYAAELDCLMALAACAREFNYVRPELTTDGLIFIKAGRHPLQELCCSPFVPNDTHSGGEESKVKVLTGPNASGKSVYIKQVALIMYLAHLGSYVPAEKASICMLDRIFTRIKSLESVSVGLSTFMIDLNQISDALRNATENSLVIIDEFGKGTETVDGVSLLCSSLKHWLSMRESCPHLFVSTHFHSLITSSPRTPITFQTMETILNEGELVFLYQLKEGSTSSSYASYVASQAGLPQEIIRRGTEVSQLLTENKPIHRVDSPSTDIQMKRHTAIVSRFLELDMDKDDLHSFLRDFVLPTNKGDI